ncbi:hypothetical protein J6590_023281 [Homalodisca vitripennis]|nr:hypothetical protein J6590_023281 [Homalodisca vitripennis]
MEKSRLLASRGAGDRTAECAIYEGGERRAESSSAGLGAAQASETDSIDIEVGDAACFRTNDLIVTTQMRTLRGNTGPGHMHQLHLQCKAEVVSRSSTLEPAYVQQDTNSVTGYQDSSSVPDQDQEQALRPNISGPLPLQHSAFEKRRNHCTLINDSRVSSISHFLEAVIQELPGLIVWCRQHTDVFICLTLHVVFRRFMEGRNTVGDAMSSRAAYNRSLTKAQVADESSRKSRAICTALALSRPENTEMCRARARRRGRISRPEVVMCTSALPALSVATKTISALMPFNR